MPPQMTATAWGRGAKNALICLVGFLAVWGLMAVAILLTFHQSILDSFGEAFAVLWGLVMVVFLGTWLYGRTTGGPLLLDCGPHPTRILFLICAVLFGISGVLYGIGSAVGGTGSKMFALGWPVFMISFAAYYLLMATGRLQVRENGIWQYWSLLRWGKIGSYRWANDSTLLLRTKGFFSWFKGALPVPPEHKQAFDELLTSHCCVPGTP